MDSGIASRYGRTLVEAAAVGVCGSKEISPESSKTAVTNDTLDAGLGRASKSRSPGPEAV
jgi:hypothetical protein